MSPTLRRPPLRRRLRNHALVALTLGLMAVANGPVVADVADQAYTDYERSRPDYMAQNGKWDTVELPEKYRTRAIHAALLYTGDVLLVAGSGNSQQKFDAGTFETILWDPVTDEVTTIETPEDLFCGGHSYLPNGNLLVAGGTKKYEVLEGKVSEAAGVLTLKNELDSGPVELPKGTSFTGPNGLQYTSTEDVTVPAAHKMADYSLMAGEADVWIRADGDSEDYVSEGGQRFTITDASEELNSTLIGTADSISFKKQNYRGLDASYIYDVAEQQYVKTGDLTMSRWYPTMVSTNGGNILAVSGLDEHGQIIEGNNEMYEISEKKWFDQPDLNRYFPTYPQLFRLEDGRLFFSGASTGYGSATKGRQPGIWDLTDNSFQDVEGLRDAEMNETATSFLLPPVQDQKVAIVGGGGVGESAKSTNRMDIADLSEDQPVYTPGADLPQAARYLSAVTLPDDTVLITGGSSDYRGKGNSDLHQTRIYDPESGRLEFAAPNEVGRNYHSTALLLPDGRVMTMGSDPLFSDEENTIPGTFETRIEIYSPPYLKTGTQRPQVTEAPEQVQRATTFDVAATSRHGIAEARLMRPSAVTHQTDTEQRAVALDVTGSCPEPAAGEDAPTCSVELSLDEREGIAPSGRYMLMVVDERGVPSPARWISVR